MDQYTDSVGASMQKLKQVLSQEGLAGFKSKLSKKQDKDLSTEIVQTIVNELENFLIHLVDCKIDQISGRIEKKLADIGAAGFSISDEYIEKIKSLITDTDEFKKLNSSFKAGSSGSSDNGGHASADAEQSTDNDDDSEYAEPIDKVIAVLNNINKDKKLKEFKEYLCSLGGGKSISMSLFGGGVNAKTLDKILPKVKFLENYYYKICESVFKAAEPAIKLGNQIKLITVDFIKTGSQMISSSAALAAATVALATSALALAASNIVLSAAIIVSATANIALAAANIVLAATNVILAITNMALAITTIVSLITITATLLAAMVVIMMSVLLSVAIVMASIIISVLVIAAVVLAMAIAISISVLALSLAIAAVVVGMSIAVILAAAVMAVAVVAIAAVISIAVLAAAAVIGIAVLAVSAVLSIAILAIAAAVALVGGALALIVFALAATIGAIALSVLAITLAVVAGLILLGVAVLAGVVMMMAAAIFLIAALTVAAVVFAGLAVTAAIATVVAMLGGIILGLLLIFMFIYLSIQNGIDSLIDWFKMTGVYKWWTEDVEPAGGLWNWIKSKFEEKWKWMNDLKEQKGGWLAAIWGGVVDWWYGKKGQNSNTQEKGSGDSTGSGLWNWIFSKMTAAWEWLKDFPGWIWDKISTGFDKTWAWLSNIGESISNGIKNWYYQSALKRAIDSIGSLVGIEPDTTPPPSWPKHEEIVQQTPMPKIVVNDAIKENLAYVQKVKASTDLKWLNEQLNIWSSPDAMARMGDDDILKNIVKSKIDQLKRRIEDLKFDGNGQKEHDIANQVGGAVQMPLDNIQNSEQATAADIESASADIANKVEAGEKEKDRQIESRGKAIDELDKKVSAANAQTGKEDKQYVPYAVPLNENTGLATENIG